MLYKNIILSTVLATVMFSGCSNKEISVNSTNENTFSEMKYKKNKYENRIIPNSISVKNKSVSNILEDLSDNKTHILIGNDLILPKSNYKVSTIKDLQHYIEMFTEQRLMKEDESARLVKWKLVNYEMNSLNKDFDIAINGQKLKLSDIMNNIGKEVGYSIINKKNITESINKEYDYQFNGSSINDFINYITNYLNIYIDVDNKKKTITLSKYRYNIFDIPISVPNIELNKEISSGKSGTGGEGFGTGSISTKFNNKVDVYAELDSYLKSIVTEDKTITINKDEVNKNSYFIQKSTGKIFISADPYTLEKATKIIEDFKANLETTINVSVAVYTVTLNEESKYGINWNMIKQNLNSAVSIGSNPNLIKLNANTDTALQTAAGNVVTNMATGGVGAAIDLGSGGILGSVLNMAGNYGNINKVEKFNVNTINNVPVVQVMSNKTPFLKSIKNEVVAGNVNTNNVVVSTPEFDEVDSGIFFYINTKTFKDSDKIMVNFSPMFSTLDGYETITYGDGEQISQPKTSLTSYNNNIMLNDGEQVIITGMITNTKSDGHDGLNPMASSTNKYINALAGTNSDSNIKKEVFIIMQATKEKN